MQLRALLLTGAALASSYAPGASPAVAARRAFLQRASGAAAAAALGVAAPGAALAAPAEVPLATSKLGGGLEAFSDVGRGFRLMRPSTWDEFTNGDGYDFKWTDIVYKSQYVSVTTTPIKSTSELSNLGEVEEVGKRLATQRGATLKSATERLTDGLLFYNFEFESDEVHELYTLTVNKSKLWAVTHTAPVKRWNKVKDLYQGSAASFMPRLS